MSTITAAMVKKLRECTGSGIMECKKALVESNGEIELAIDNLRKSGKVKAAKKANCVAAEGLILTKISQDKTYGVIIEINSETDFVAKDNCFQSFGRDIINTAMERQITDLNILKDNFEDQRLSLINKVGENINIRRLGTLRGEVLGSYMHSTRIGVIVAVTPSSTNDNIVKNIAMHIAASKPEYVNPSDVPYNIVSREEKIQLAIAIQSNKPSEIIKKIVEGRIHKFVSEISLTGQNFILNPDKTVGQILDEHSTIVNNFIRFEVCEGTDKDEAIILGKLF